MQVIPSSSHYLRVDTLLFWIFYLTGEGFLDCCVLFFCFLIRSYWLLFNHSTLITFILSQYPSGDPCDFLSSSVTDLKRILQGTSVFSWGNEEFLEETCNWEVSWILPGFETRFPTGNTQFSIQLKSGSCSRCCGILIETCNWEVVRILPGFQIGNLHGFEQFSISWVPGSYSRCCGILVETCNWEVGWILSRFETRSFKDFNRFLKV